MKAFFSFIISVSLLLLAIGCSEESDELQSVTSPEEKPSEETPATLPEGYFEVTFTPGSETTRGAVSGADDRVSRLRYLIYDSLGNFVKEKAVVTSATGIPVWPLVALKDTLRIGKYTAVFLANVDKTIFTYKPAPGGADTQTEVLTNYKGKIDDARIVLPAAQFSPTTEYYWAKVPFSNTSASPYVLLQRIISLLNVHRNVVDAQLALNQLVNNIVTNMHYKDQIRTQVNAILPGLLRGVLDKGLLGNVIYATVGGLDGAVNLLLATLVTPVTDALYNILLQQLVNQLGMALTGNTNQSGTLAFLGVLLNPWAQNEAGTAIVTIRDFPKTMDFNLTVQDKYVGDHSFRFDFTSGTVYDEKDIPIRGFHGLFDIRRINVVKYGLVSGLLFDRVVDSSYLLNGRFVDINTELQATVATNYRYKANYSFIDLGLNSYTPQTDAPHSLTIQVALGAITGIDTLFSGIPLLGPILNLATNGLLAPLKNITVSVPINLPLLGVDNLNLSAQWSPVTQY